LNKKKPVIIITSVAALTLFSGVIFLKVTQADGTDFKNTEIIQAFDETPYTGEVRASDDNDYTYIPPTPIEENHTGEVSSNALTEEEPFVPATEMDLDPSSITVFVNKEYALPKDYKPEKLVTPDVVFNLITYDERTLMRPEAAEALELLFDAAERDGIILYGISGYRSYDRQGKIFTNNIVKKGKTYTLRYSAVPGTSEHQTGLAIDVSAKSQNFKLSTGFSSSPEGIWLAKNAHNYGYIIRYPEGNEEITGYAYEPWHIRYVGKDLATYLYTNKLTLEEYYHYTPSPSFDFEKTYAAYINYVPPVVTEIPAAEDEVIVDENGEVIEGDNEQELPEEGSKDTKPTDKDSDITDTPIEDELPGKKPVDKEPEEPSDSDEEPEKPSTQEPGSEEPIQSVTPTPTPTPTPSLSLTPTPMVENESDITSAALSTDPNMNQ
jgi:zinc D-Ala-D-Ala carboxypeptidase